MKFIVGLCCIFIGFLLGVVITRIIISIDYTSNEDSLKEAFNAGYKQCLMDIELNKNK